VLTTIHAHMHMDTYVGYLPRLYRAFGRGELLGFFAQWWHVSFSCAHRCGLLGSMCVMVCAAQVSKSMSMLLNGRRRLSVHTKLCDVKCVCSRKALRDMGVWGVIAQCT